MIHQVFPFANHLAAQDDPTGKNLAAARENVRQEMLTLGAGISALFVLIFTWRNYLVSRSTFRQTETRVLGERFAAASKQLGDNNPAVRLAGVHALAQLADVWEEKRQACIDVLCSYLRLNSEKDELTRETVVRLIAEHLRGKARPSWQRLHFNFTGAVFKNVHFDGAVFNGKVEFDGARFEGYVDFDRCKFAADEIRFNGATFADGNVTTFHDSVFSRGEVSFRETIFDGAVVAFDRANFAAKVHFDSAEFKAGEVWFTKATFADGVVTFDHPGEPSQPVQFKGSEVNFTGTKFKGAKVSFKKASVTDGAVTFHGAEFSRGTVCFAGMEVAGGVVAFNRYVEDKPASFEGSKVYFCGAKFSVPEVWFPEREWFSGGLVDFSKVDGKAVRPKFGWGEGESPACVMLPRGWRQGA